MSITRYQSDGISPVGVTLRSRRGDSVEYLAHIIDELIANGITICETPYRLPIKDHPRISELKGSETKFVMECFDRLHRLSFHGPMGNTLLSNYEVNKAVTQSLRSAIQEAALIGAEVIVVHIEPTFPNIEFKGWGKGDIVEQLKDLAEFASCYGVKMGIETQYPYKIEDYLNLIDEVDHEYLGATVDVGHLFDRRVPEYSGISMKQLRSPEGPALYNQILMELVKQLQKRNKLFHIHLHQHRLEALLADPWPYGSCDHWDLSEGIIDIPTLFRTLKQGQYRGMIICEISRGSASMQGGQLTPEELMHSINLAKQLWREENYDEIS